MSRGLGKTQRFVLDRLQADRDYQTAYDLAASITGQAPPSATAVHSVRQAIRRLEERGLVETTQSPWVGEEPPPRIVQRRGRTLHYEPARRNRLAVRLRTAPAAAAPEMPDADWEMVLAILRAFFRDLSVPLRSHD